MKTTNEDWRDIADCPGYQVSSCGKIRAIRRSFTKSNGVKMTCRDRPRKTTVRKDGYFQVRLKGSDGRVKNRLVHRLVALAFIPNPEGKREVNHKDNDPMNNLVENLEWMTTKENVGHAHVNGFVKHAKGSGHPQAKLSEWQIPIIREWAGQGKTPTQIAQRLAWLGIRITASAVGYIVRRKTWRHVKKL